MDLAPKHMERIKEMSPLREMVPECFDRLSIK